MQEDDFKGAFQYMVLMCMVFGGFALYLLPLPKNAVIIEHPCRDPDLPKECCPNKEKIQEDPCKKKKAEKKGCAKKNPCGPKKKKC